MKKLLLATGFLLISIMFTNAQELGFRFGEVSGGNVAVDAVFSTGKFNRVHADASFGHGLGIDVIWDFIYRPIGEEAINWYAGVGPYTFLGDPFQLGVVGEIGIEYQIKSVPISIGADWRPLFRLIDHTDFGAEGFGFNIRWRFNE